MVKKILKWTGISLLVIIILLVATPFIFKDKIKGDSQPKVYKYYSINQFNVSFNILFGKSE